MTGLPLYLRLECVRGTFDRDPMRDNGNHGTIRIGTWNTRWAKPRTPEGTIISDKLATTDGDVLCVTDGFGDSRGRGACHLHRPQLGLHHCSGPPKVLL